MIDLFMGVTAKGEDEENELKGMGEEREREEKNSDMRDAHNCHCFLSFFLFGERTNSPKSPTQPSGRATKRRRNDSEKEEGQGRKRAAAWWIEHNCSMKK